MKKIKRNRVFLSALVISLSLCPLYGAKKNPFSRPAFLSQKTGQKNGESAEEKKPETTLANLSLTGIINGKLAVINHQFYRKGQKIGILTITAITANKVVLESRGVRYDLILNLSKIKRKE
ncbi:MAG: hypothetical protein GXO69_04485 [Acidobacteria bacterium]|nr:hypothetical protein [Acidobacteriota bacterium]